MVDGLRAPVLGTKKQERLDKTDRLLALDGIKTTLKINQSINSLLISIISYNYHVDRKTSNMRSCDQSYSPVIGRVTGFT